MSRIRAVGSAWDEMEPPVLKFLLRVVLTVGAFAASPFLALAFLFFLLDKPLLWIAVPLAIAATLVVLALVAWLIARSKLRAVRARIEQAATIEGHLRGDVIDTDAGARK